ncbi:MAG: DUF4124 domain-containing protein [Oxalobacteraceae bacterium]|nr:DUF4124 domain-containing protein [Oxalobacteraceae bacterium]
MYCLKRQRGLSLLWCAVLMALLAVAAMVALFSLRFERNLPAEIWSRARQAGAAAGLLQRAAGAAVDAPPAAVRRCTVDGTVLYSNIDCDVKKSGSKAVDLHLTQGLEAPKAPPEAAAAVRFGDGFPERPPTASQPAR